MPVKNPALAFSTLHGRPNRADSRVRRRESYRLFFPFLLESTRSQDNWIVLGIIFDSNRA